METDKTRQFSRGKLVYLQHCVICHQSTGQGSPGTFPPLAKSDFLLKEKQRSILAVGSKGRVYVLEYTRQTDNKAEFGMLPGRILELAVIPQAGR